MEPMAVAGMIFTLIALLLVGGIVLLFPLSIRLGKVMEQWLNERKLRQVEGGDAAELRRTVQALEAEVRRLAERQEFTEQLLQSGEAPSLPAGEEAGRIRG